MNRTIKLLLIALVLAGGPAHALAQVAVAPPTDRDAAGSLTLEEALRRSLRYNPEFARLDAALADKLGRAIEAEVKVNPTFKVGAGYASRKSEDGGAFEVEAEQPLRPSDFGLRKTYAVALRAAANLEQKADVLRVLNSTAIIYYRAWALQERAALLGGARAQAEDVLTTIQQQLEAGQSNVSQRSIFEAETARFAAELVAVRGELAGALAELGGVIGLAATELRLVRPAFGTLPSTAALSAFSPEPLGNSSHRPGPARGRREESDRRSRRRRLSGICPRSRSELRPPGKRIERWRDHRRADSAFGIEIWERSLARKVHSTPRSANSSRSIG